MRRDDPRLPGPQRPGVRLAPPAGRAVAAALAVLVLAWPLAEPAPARAATPSTTTSGTTVEEAARAAERAAAAAEAAEAAWWSDPVVHRPPVDGRVLRPFVPPDGPYGAGHRGVDLAAAPGTAVRATARGTVAHAGRVVGATWVSIDHPDGLRTSYGPLAAVTVAPGRRVAAGDVLGVVAAADHGDPVRDAGLHLGVRRGDAYLDPATVPDLAPPRPTLLDVGGWRAADLAVVPYTAWEGGRLGGVLTHGSPDAVAPGYAVPPSPNHLVLVAGFGTDSDGAILDARHLGYDLAGVTHLSHAGRRAEAGRGAVAADAGPVGPDAGPWRDQLPYVAADTWGGVARAAGLLRDQLRAQAAREPGRAVDLVGHSFGGVTIAYYLLHLHDPYDRTLPPVGHVVTIASPLEGSDLARLADAVDANGATGPALRGVLGLLARTDGPLAAAGGLDPGSRTVDDLGTGSDPLAVLADAWGVERTAGAAGAFATGTRWLSIAGSTDVVVGAHRAALPGEASPDGAVPAPERRVLPGGHSGVLATEAVREVVWRFLADRDVVASPGRLATAGGAVLGRGLLLAATVLGDRDAAGALVGPPGAS